MKGIVYNLLEQIVIAEHGEDTWDDLLDQTGLQGSWTSLGSYPDEDFVRIVRAAAAVLDPGIEDPVRWFGRSALPLLAGAYPAFFTPYDGLRPFLLTLNDIIHPEVRKLYPGADAPTFDFDTSQPGVLVMGYASKRGLCTFGEGLIEGAAEHYSESVIVDQPQCTHRGDSRCLLRVSAS